MSILEQIEADIKEFLDKGTKLFFNERDFQVNLAFFLMNKRIYDNIFLEYSLPLLSKKMKEKEAEWEKKGRDLSFFQRGGNKSEASIRIDVVVEKDGLFYPIELKYKTKQKNGEIQRFKEDFGKIEILKNHGARNIGRYSFWKDVARLEFIKDSFEKVKGGFCVFITNDDKYTKKPTDSSENFTMQEDFTEPLKGPLFWKDDFKLGNTTLPKFSLQGKHKIKGWSWRSFVLGCDTNSGNSSLIDQSNELTEDKKINFYYYIVEV